MNKTQQQKLIDVLTELGIAVELEVDGRYTEVTMEASVSGRVVAFVFKDGKYDFSQ